QAARDDLFLGNRFVERRDDRVALLLARTRFVLVVGGRHGRARQRQRVFDQQAGGEPLDLLGVEDFARQQRLGDLFELRLVRRQDRVRALVVVGDEALHLVVDLQRRVLAIVLVLRDLPAEEDLLLF